MTTQTTEPITLDWTTEDPTDRSADATALEVNGRLARFEVADLQPALTPYLAAAAAELALLADISWRFSTDDAPVALLRAIARVAIAHPEVGGPHATRLYEQLT